MLRTRYHETDDQIKNSKHEQETGRIIKQKDLVTRGKTKKQAIKMIKEQTTNQAENQQLEVGR